MNLDKDQILQLLRSQGQRRPGQPGQHRAARPGRHRQPPARRDAVQVRRRSQDSLGGKLGGLGKL